MMLYKNFEELKQALITEDGSCIIALRCAYRMRDYLAALAREKNYIPKYYNFCDDDIKALFSEPSDTGNEYRERWLEKRAEWAKEINNKIIDNLAKDISNYVLNSIQFIRLSNAGKDIKSLIGFSLDPTEIEFFGRKTAAEFRENCLNKLRDL